MYHYIFSIDGIDAFKSCLCFDPLAPVGSRISQIADMNYARVDHSLVVANGKLYAIGGWTEILHILYEIFSNLDIKKITRKIFVIQSRNTIHKRMNGVKSKN